MKVLCDDRRCFQKVWAGGPMMRHCGRYLVEAMKSTPGPRRGSVCAFREGSGGSKWMLLKSGPLWYIGGMPVQIGYCNGHNTKLNALGVSQGVRRSMWLATDAVLMSGTGAGCRAGRHLRYRRWRSCIFSSRGERL